MRNTSVDPQFWKSKKVFVTGHTGFKGSWLSIWLHMMGAKVKGFSLPPETQPNLFQIANVSELLQSEFGDIRNLEALKNSLQSFAPDIVLHLAAQPLVRRSYQTPLETYAINVMGTAHVLEACRGLIGLKSVVVITTDKCYDNKEWIYGYRETDALGGYDPYSSSKACAEIVTTSYRNSFFNPDRYSDHGVAVCSARAGNVIGGGDWSEDRLVPDIVRSLQKRQVVPIRNPHAIRPWQHVLEPIGGYLLLAQQSYVEGPAFAESFNIGPADRDCISVENLVRQACQCWGEDARFSIEKGQHPHEASFLKLDSSKAHSKLGWWPRWTTERAVQLSIAWYKSANSALASSRSQIELYMGENT